MIEKGSFYAFSEYAAMMPRFLDGIYYPHRRQATFAVEHNIRGLVKDGARRVIIADVDDTFIKARLQHHEGINRALGLTLPFNEALPGSGWFHECQAYCEKAQEIFEASFMEMFAKYVARDSDLHMRMRPDDGVLEFIAIMNDLNAPTAGYLTARSSEISAVTALSILTHGLPRVPAVHLSEANGQHATAKTDWFHEIDPRLLDYIIYLDDIGETALAVRDQFSQMTVGVPLRSWNEAYASEFASRSILHGDYTQLAEAVKGLVI